MTGIQVRKPLRRRFRWRAATRQLARIEQQAAELESVPDDELTRRSLALRYRALTGESTARLLPAAFALMREAAHRTLSMRHYDVQLLGGIALHDRAIAEMQTGEGKTLTATLPLYLAALEGRGAHLATANDYLARRDAEQVQPAFALLGMRVGIIESASARADRQQAYACDVTYAAAREFGFDFLRDRLQAGRHEIDQNDRLGRMLGQSDDATDSQPIQRERHYMLVDEADNTLIDEARTPLIVSALPATSADAAAELFRWAASAAADFQDESDFHHDPQKHRLRLTAEGRQAVRQLKRPPSLASVPLFDLYEHIERALRVEREFELDRHYVIRDGDVVIVDENTGRLADGRKWRDGIHQAIEAREDLTVSTTTGEAARVTVQEFFSGYKQLAGMTGTAWSGRRELARIYQLQTRVIATHRPVRREAWEDAIFGTPLLKWEAIVDEVRHVHDNGRPVLIGTRTIEKSERLSELLTEAAIDHEVLNARRHAEEAEIVAQAGTAGRVTVATNMAGRGTDIRLGEGVAELGGLHVICTELHESARIDRQLIGRCSRQGDPGSYRRFLSLGDDILRAAYGQRKAEQWMKQANRVQRQPGRYIRLLRAAQAKVERQHFRQRCLLMYHEKRRRQLQQEMGQDPFLDAAG